MLLFVEFPPHAKGTNLCKCTLYDYTLRWYRWVPFIPSFIFLCLGFAARSNYADGATPCVVQGNAGNDLEKASGWLSTRRLAPAGSFSHHRATIVSSPHHIHFQPSHGRLPRRLPAPALNHPFKCLRVFLDLSSWLSRCTARWCDVAAPRRHAIGLMCACAFCCVQRQR